MKMKQGYLLSVILFLVSESSSHAADKVSTAYGGRSKEQSSIQDRSLIIGGDSASLDEYPYFVHYNSPGCGGALIAPDIVLTAGHCKLGQPSNYGTLYIGEYSLRGTQDGAEAFSVVEDSRHPSFDDQVCCGRAGSEWFYGVQNDFLLLKLSGQSSIRPVRLNKNATRPISGDELTVIGFGDIDPGSDYVEPNILKEVTLNYITNDDCVTESIYPANLLDESSMCATDTSEDACAGDSGGPLLIKGGSPTGGDLMVGIVSWGWECGVYPGVYARVSQGYSWIRREVCRLSDHPPARFNCPTMAPVPTPTPPPRARSTPHPTRRPTRRPTPLPTRLPTLPADYGVSTEKYLAPTPKPTLSGNAHADEANEINTVTTSSSEIPNQGNNRTYTSIYQVTNTTTSIARRPLPEGTPCSVASTSPVVCCSSISSTTEYGTSDCIPVQEGRDYGVISLSCESSSWVQSHDPESYDPSMCDLLLSTTTTTTTTTSSEGSSVLGNRQYLPLGMACSDVNDYRECCGYLDNREQQDSIYYGQPCVPLRSSGNNVSDDGGICQPANWVAEHSPELAMDCRKLQRGDDDDDDDETIVLSNSTDAWQAYLQHLLQAIKQDILWERGERTIERIDLPSGQSCDTIEDPLVCCAARHVDLNMSRVCVPKKTALAGKPDGNHRPQFKLTCRSMEEDDMEDDNEHSMFNSSLLDGVTSSSTTTSTMTTSSTSSTSSSSNTFCDRMVRTLQRRTRLSRLECSSLRSTRTCCSAVDQRGQPCMPIQKGQGDDPTCASMEWVVSHHPNVTLLECPKIPSVDLY